MIYVVRTRDRASALSDLCGKLKRIEKDPRVIEGVKINFMDVPSDIQADIKLPGNRIINKHKHLVKDAINVYYAMSAIKRLEARGVVVSFDKTEALF